MRSVEAWRKSSYSSGEGQCVEVQLGASAVLVRDSKYLADPANDPVAQPIISVPIEHWHEFLDLAVGLPSSVIAAVPSIVRTGDGGTAVRADDGTTLLYTSAEWSAFVAGIQKGEFSVSAAA